MTRVDAMIVRRRTKPGVFPHISQAESVPPPISLPLVSAEQPIELPISAEEQVVGDCDFLIIEESIEKTSDTEELLQVSELGVASV
jgi:hypothetical protein